MRILCIIIGCGAFIIVAGHLLGRTLLEIIYGVDLSSYKLHFIVLLAGGTIGAAVYMTYNILIAIRKGNCLIVVYTITAVLTILPSKLMVQKWGVMGACLNYFYSCSLLFIQFIIILIYVVLKRRKQIAAES